MLLELYFNCESFIFKGKRLDIILKSKWKFGLNFMGFD